MSDDEESVTIGLRVRRERDRRKWTQTELVARLAAEGVQTSTMTISRVEKGQPATFTLVRGLAATFGLSPEELATPEPEAERKKREDAEHALATTLEELLVAWRDVYDLSDRLATLGTTEAPAALVDRLMLDYFGLTIELNQRTHPFIREDFRKMAHGLVRRGMTDRAGLARQTADAKRRGDAAAIQESASRRAEADAFESAPVDEDLIPVYAPKEHRAR